MAQFKLSLPIDASGATCSSTLANVNDCYASQAKAGATGGLTFGDLGTSVGAGASLVLPAQNKFVADPLGFAPMQVVSEEQNWQFNWSAIFVPLKLKWDYENASEEAEAAAIGVVNERLQNSFDKQRHWGAYVQGGSFSIKPENPLRTGLINPLGGLPPGFDYSAKYAVKGGFVNIPLGPFSLGAEGGTGKDGPTVGSSDILSGENYSTLLSAMIAFTPQAALRGNWEHTQVGVPEDAERSLFGEGPGTTTVDAVYARFEWKRWQLFGSYSDREVTEEHFEEGATVSDGETVRTRESFYGGLKIPLDVILKKAAFGVMFGRNEVTATYEGLEGGRVSASSQVGSGELQLPLPNGFSAILYSFIRSARGDDFAEFSDSGLFAKLAYNHDLLGEGKK